MRPTYRPITLGLTLALCTGSCGSEPPATPGESYEDPGAELTLTPPAERAKAYAAQRDEVTQATAISRAEFDRTYPAPQGTLEYDPLMALNLDKVQGSSFALDTAQLDVLGSQGFVLMKNRAFMYMLDGLSDIYAEDLPLYVSADSILDAVHQSYDEILKRVEVQALTPLLESMITRLRTRLAAGHGNVGTAAKDLALYLSVADGLLTGKAPSDAAAKELYTAASRAEGTASISLFGVAREEDFSQFKPRGHYTETEELARYFQAMMWLGRVDLRLIETQPDGSQLFRRRQTEAMLALHDLFDEAAMAEFEAIDGTLQEFVGESDFMTVRQVAAYRTALGLERLAQVRDKTDQKLADALVQGGFGLQRIASSLITNLTSETLPLNTSFALLGQRYTLDSHVFSNVTWARTKAMRMMPNPLDVAFGALGNDQAASLLASELDLYAYQGNLQAMRLLGDAHGADYWTSSLYTSWLDGLRGLSPRNLPDDAPTLMHTEGWGRRILNAQLGSWAQLRHDTILYAKQSYTDGAACEFPDAYVEPYPAFWQAMVRYAERGIALADRLEGVASAPFVDSLREYFMGMRSTVTTLAAMADQELSGTPFTTEQLAFINEAIRIDPEEQGCGSPPQYFGWYTRLLYTQTNEYDPTIADVHTQPTDEGGNEVGRVLHVGTAAPRATVVTVPTCEGPRAYVGLAFAYHELVTEDYLRLTDDEWANMQAPADVSWLAPVSK